jgi:hypothetical protein
MRKAENSSGVNVTIDSTTAEIRRYNATFRLRATRYDRYDPKLSTLKVNKTVNTARDAL